MTKTQSSSSNLRWIDPVPFLIDGPNRFPFVARCDATRPQTNANTAMLDHKRRAREESSGGRAESAAKGVQMVII